ncbi:MAG: hypothetical protein QW416_05920 [Candidatus Nitrosocaldaceae archaeon]
MVSIVFSESIILISSIILATAFTGIILSKTGTLESMVSSATSMQRSNILTDIKIIYVTNTTSSTVVAWVKNVGKQPIVDIDAVDIYFGPIKSVNMIPYNNGGSPTWIYEDTSTWDIMETKKIIISYGSSLSNTTYMLSIATPNGITDEYIFSPP